MIGDLLPCAAVAETYRDVLDEPLRPEEELAVSRAVEKRRNEFRTVRACARRALAELGTPARPWFPAPAGHPPGPRGSWAR